MKYNFSKAMIIGGGEKPSRRTALKLIRTGYSIVICADGGYDHAKKMGIVPDFIIGDFDSVGDLSGLSDKCKLVRIRRQNDTDVEKCIKFAVSAGAAELVLLGGIGDRLDHSIANLGLIAKYSEILKMTLFYGRSYCSVLHGLNKFASRKGEIVSIYGLTEDTIVSTSGLKYELHKDNIYLGGGESTSNIARKKYFIVEVLTGKALLVREADSYFL